MRLLIPEVPPIDLVGLPKVPARRNLGAKKSRGPKTKVTRLELKSGAVGQRVDYRDSLDLLADRPAARDSEFVPLRRGHHHLTGFGKLRGSSPPHI